MNDISESLKNFVFRLLAGNSSALLLTTGALVLIQFGSNLVLTRLLEPEAFAIGGIIGSIFFTMNLVTDAGFRTYIIRNKQKDNQDLLATCWTLKLIRGFLLSMVLAATAAPISNYVGAPEIKWPLIVCSVIFALNSLQAMSFIKSERANKVAKPLYLSFGHNVFSKIVVILTAFQYHNYWAFVIGRYAESLAKLFTSYTLFKDTKVRFFIDKKYLPEFWNFSKVIIPSSILTVILMQGDKLILSKALSLEELGLYYFALSFAAVGNRFISAYGTRIILPFTSLEYRENPEQLAHSYYKKKTFTISIVAFSLGVIAAGASPILSLLYPDKYLAAANYLLILLIHPVLSCISFSAENCLLAVGKTKVVLVSNILRLIWVSISAVVFYHYLGSIGVVIAYSFKELLPSFYLLWLMKEERLLNLVKEIQIVCFALLGYTLAYTWLHFSRFTIS